MRALKRPPIEESWARDAFCKGKNPLLWEMDAPIPEGKKAGVPWRVGRKHCIEDCIVRVKCLRKALTDEGGTVGVVRGGIAFSDGQHRKKRTMCLVCQLPVAPQMHNAEGEIVRGICYVCKRYSPCLRNCGRMARRKPYIDRDYCTYCKSEWGLG